MHDCYLCGGACYCHGDIYGDQDDYRWDGDDGDDFGHQDDPEPVADKYRENDPCPYCEAPLRYDAELEELGEYGVYCPRGCAFAAEAETPKDPE